MLEPFPPFRTVLELVLWNGLESCHHTTPDVISVTKYACLSIFLLFSGRGKSHWGLDPVNRKVVRAQLFVY
jgi:hypothetical protein